jgi:hypothetical protein
VPDLKQLGRHERRDGLLVLVEMAIREYVKDVRDRRFPGEAYTYSIKEEELAHLRLSSHWKCDQPLPVDGTPASVHVPTNGAEQGVAKD